MDKDGTFKKRTGTGAEHGQKYEKLLCLRLVQWLEENKKEFEIANNVDNIGDLDDIVCKIKEGGSDIYFFLQAKHAENDKKLTTEANDKNFGLTKMFKSFLIIRDYLSKTSKKNQKFELSFVTNRIVDSTFEKNVSIVTDENTFLSIVLGESGESRKCYKIPNIPFQMGTNIFHNELKSEDEKLVKEFMDHLRIYVEQYNNEGLEKLIKKKMREQYPYNESDVNTLFLKIDKKINDWYEQKDKVKCLAEKGRLFLNEQIKFYKNTLPELVNYEMLHFSDEYLAKLSDKLKKNKIICAKFKIEEMQFYTTLWLRFVSYVSSINKQNDENVLYIDESIDTSLLANVIHIKLISCCITKQNENVAKIISCLQKLSEEQNVQLFLLLEETCKVELSFNKSNQIDPFSLTQLSKESSEYFLQKKIVFQGEVAILNVIISDDTKDLIDVSMITNLCMNPSVEIGKKLDDLGVVESYYMQRDFIINNVSTVVAYFKQFTDSNDIFCFLVKYELQLQQQNCFVLKRKEEFDKICSKNQDKNIHLFKQSDSGVKYIKTKGSDNIIKNKFDFDDKNKITISEKNFISLIFDNLSDSRYICISDIPGNGKSIMITNLSLEMKKIYKNMWVVAVNLTELKNISDNNISAESVISVLSHCLGYTDNKTIALFHQFCLIPKKVIILLDAYDEISPHYVEKVANFLSALKKTKIEKFIIATRPHCVKSINKIFNNLEVFNMSTFSKPRQKDFISKYWRQQLKEEGIQNISDLYIENCVEKLITHVNKFQIDEFQRITGVPLLLKIFSVCYYTNFKDSIHTGNFIITDEAMNIDSIYQKFLTEKLNILFKIKFNIKDENIMSNVINIKRDSTFQSHFYLAAREIFSKDIVLKYFKDENNSVPKEISLKIFKEEKTLVEKDEPERLGILLKKDEQYLFIHRTFAEYFCALKIISKIITVNANEFVDFFNFFLSDILNRDEYIVIREFLNENIMNISKEVLPTDKYFFVQCSSKNDGNILYLLSEERLDNIYKWLEESVQCLGNKEIFYSTILNKKLSLVFQMGNKNDKHYEIDLYKHSNSTENRESLFCEALQKGYVCIVETMIENAPECVNSYRFIDHFGTDMSALQYVCDNQCKREEEMIKLLFEKGAVVNNERKYYELMPLIASIFSRKIINVIELLVEKGADVNETCKDGMTPLMYAAQYDRLDIVELLITKYKVGVNLLCDEQCSALFYAICDENIEIVQFMLDHGAIVHSNTLIEAVKYCNFEITELLLEKEADVANDIQDSDIHDIFKYIINLNLYLDITFEKLVSTYKLSKLESLKKYATEIVNLFNKYRTTTKLKVPDISRIDFGQFSLNGSLICFPEFNFD